MKTNRAVIIQCRLSSTRLPEKALKTLGNKNVLSWVLASMKKVPAQRYFVATDEASYEKLQPVCKENGYEIFKGDLNNVLKRFCDLIKLINCETVIRATADNPFLFYEAAVDSLNDYENLIEKEQCDYLTYSGLPHGSGVEIINAASLIKASENTTSSYDEEHVGPALYQHQDKFVCRFIPAPEKYNFPALRSTIDTIGDFYRAQRVVHYLGIQNEPYTTEQILNALNCDYVKNPVVYVPSVKKGHGTGHLYRTLSAVSVSKDFVYIPENPGLEETSSLINEFLEKGLEKWQIIDRFPDEIYKPVIVSDAFSLEKSDFEKFKNRRALICIDEGSAYTDYADYVLDIIPSYKLFRKSNAFNPGLIELPENKKDSRKNKSPSEITKVLVCIGGEDPANLTEKAAFAIKKLLPKSEVFAVSSKDYSDKNINFIKPVKNLKEQLYTYDLVITHYGLTCFEAASSGCGVILVSTSNLHENLGKKYGFSYIGYKKLNEKSLEKALNSKNLYPKLNFSNEEKLSDFVSNLASGQKLSCPVCQNLSETSDGLENCDEIISRNETRTYRKCSKCKMVYISWSSIKDRKYEKSYFFNEYKNQYGKTYEEDFASIKKSGFSRTANILKLNPSENQTILDIGCAYGPFLSAAKDSGFLPYGTDISDDAVNYVNEKLKIPSSVGAFPDFDSEKTFNISQFDCCSMWYVIEHFKNLDSVLKKVNSLVKKGGVFAFSTPSGQGVSAVSDRDYFYTISPKDHFSVWDFNSAKRVMKKYGFKVEKIVSTGHHPERFPSIKKHNSKKDSLFWKWILFFSRTKKLGDTMEIYCRKIRDL